MATKRPFGVTILALLAALAAVIAIVHTLQMLGLFRIQGPFGMFSFFGFNFWGAVMWGILALIYIWVVRKLWNLDPQGWLFVVALATINLIFAVVSIIGQSSWQAMLPSIIVNGLILIYGLLPGTKAAFGMFEAEPEPAAEAVAEPAAEVVAEPAVEPEPEENVVVAEEEGVAAEEEVAESAEEEEIATEEAADPAAVTGVAAASHDPSYIEGVGEVYSAKLEEAGVDSPQSLLERGATPKGRKELAASTGISEHLILKWVDEVDLFRISGLGAQYADLLRAAGVSTILDLAQRNPEHLYPKLIEVNEAHRRVRHAPSQALVEDWVNQAKELPRVVSY